MFFVKSTPYKKLQRLAISLETFQPSRVFLFFASLKRVNESDQKWGVSKYPFLACLCEGIPHRLYQVWEVPLTGKILPLFGTLRIGVPRTSSKTPPVGHSSSSWLLWNDQNLRPTSKRPTAQTRSNVISIHYT